MRGASLALVCGVMACTAEAPRLIDEPEWVPQTAGLDSVRWRCRTREGQRECRRRSRDASTFICTQSDCIQKWPRLPDENEWDCQAAGGPVLCVFYASSEGLAVRAREGGFTCGPRRGHDTERVCLDVDPDLPVGDGPWACRFDASRHGAKICVHANTKNAVVAERVPECWLDTDCGESGARCVIGRCEGA